LARSYYFSAGDNAGEVVYILYHAYNSASNFLLDEMPCNGTIDVYGNPCSNYTNVDDKPTLNDYDRKAYMTYVHFAFA
jgi:hypothetical protein